MVGGMWENGGRVKDMDEEPSNISMVANMKKNGIRISDARCITVAASYAAV